MCFWLWCFVVLFCVQFTSYVFYVVVKSMLRIKCHRNTSNKTHVLFFFFSLFVRTRKKEPVYRKAEKKEKINYLNPLTATTCKMFGLNYAGRRLQTVYFPVLEHPFSVLRFLMIILSHASAKKKKESRVSNFAPLWVVFKCRHGSEGANSNAYGNVS